MVEKRGHAVTHRHSHRQTDKQTYRRTLYQMYKYYMAPMDEPLSSPILSHSLCTTEHTMAQGKIVQRYSVTIVGYLSTIWPKIKWRFTTVRQLCIRHRQVCGVRIFFWFASSGHRILHQHSTCNVTPRHVLQWPISGQNRFTCIRVSFHLTRCGSVFTQLEMAKSETMPQIN